MPHIPGLFLNLDKPSGPEQRLLDIFEAMMEGREVSIADQGELLVAVRRSTGCTEEEGWKVLQDLRVFGPGLGSPADLSALEMFVSKLVDNRRVAFSLRLLEAEKPDRSDDEKRHSSAISTAISCDLP
jgi:hypothetical protein